MIAKAAVQVEDIKRNVIMTIPCHRHCDAFMILKEFGYEPKDYEIVEQGFLTETNLFLNRTQAKRHAQACGQDNSIGTELFSEDLW